MADTHEEQLLSDLLQHIGREDVQLRAPHLEARVIDTFRAEMATPARRVSARAVAVACLGVAAAVAVAVVSTLRPTVAPSGSISVAGAPRTATEVAVANRPPAPVPAKGARKRQPAPPSPARAAGIAHAEPAIPESPSVQLPAAQIPVAHTPLEFVPLMPLTEQDLTGPFQIVRVQMPKASLGSLRSPLDHPSEMVEADVLLGEDGRARAIRVSTDGSRYPWRSPR